MSGEPIYLSKISLWINLIVIPLLLKDLEKPRYHWSQRTYELMKYWNLNLQRQREKTKRNVTEVDKRDNWKGQDINKGRRNEIWIGMEKRKDEILE